MSKDSLLINVGVGETRIALIEDGILAELYVERTRERSPVGNIYLGKVTRVLPGMQAAFVDIGLERAAFLHVEDIVTAEPESEKPTEEAEDAEGTPKSGDEGEGKGAKKTQSRSKKRGNSAKSRKMARKRSREIPIRDVLKEGQPLMVQVNKGPISTKGARVTGHFGLPGRYVIYTPTVDNIGISKRIGSDRERQRLKEVIESIKPESGGIIVRTIGEGLTINQLKSDINYLSKNWETTLKKQKATKAAPALLYEDLDVILRAARDLFTDSIGEIVIDDPKEFERLRAFLAEVLPHRVEDVKLYDGSDPFFDEYGVESEIARGLARKVPLTSGGHLIIDQAEALAAIDVNTGRFTGKGKDVEETILQTNLEAVTEISYQLRFRNLGGLIVLDFIDMERQSNRNKVYRSLVAALKKDKAKTTAVRISELGLVEMTRKRTRESLNRTLNEPCFYCDGTGQLRSKDTICHEIFRQVRREGDSLPGYKIVINAHPAVCDKLEREEHLALAEIATRFQRRIVLKSHRDYHLEQFDLVGG